MYWWRLPAHTSLKTSALPNGLPSLEKNPTGSSAIIYLYHRSYKYNQRSGDAYTFVADRWAIETSEVYKTSEVSIAINILAFFSRNPSYSPDVLLERLHESTLMFVLQLKDSFDQHNHKKTWRTIVWNVRNIWKFLRPFLDQLQFWINDLFYIIVIAIFLVPATVQDHDI